ncbi:hypothetical protein EDB89DRAFT_2069233 [Lactarius sanguifluus]|nr:hypothetical protein EDB89DRAFT_2069233 [Lactarius sanguifluus]
MSSFEKVVKNACKPKPTLPKSKYVDPIIAATWSEHGAIHDVCKARSREPNSIVVFKALIVLHTMVRNGATDYLSSSDILRLKNVSGGQWEGYNAPKNLQHYALYLDTRIRSYRRGYRDLKHDAIRVQSETKIPQLCKFVDRSEKLTILSSFKLLYPLPFRYSQDDCRARHGPSDPASGSNCSLTLRIPEYGSEVMEVTRVVFAIDWSLVTVDAKVDVRRLSYSIPPRR